jgi:hypothetical protein
MLLLEVVESGLEISVRMLWLSWTIGELLCIHCKLFRVYDVSDSWLAKHGPLLVIVRASRSTYLYVIFQSRPIGSGDDRYLRSRR